MGGGRNPVRESHVRALNQIAVANNVRVVPENASRVRVKQLVESLLALNLAAHVAEEVKQSSSAYEETFPHHATDHSPPSTAPEQGKVWKFSAVQLTYNCSHGDFAAVDMDVLRALFDRFVHFLSDLAQQLGGQGLSATMERASEVRVHLHAYMHLERPFHRRGVEALRCFEFEGVRPHVVANTASGKAYMGAVRLGHFYVVVDKLGTLWLGLERGLGSDCGLKF